MPKGMEKMLENAQVFLKIYSIVATLIVGTRMFLKKNSTPFDLAALVFVLIYVADV